MVNLDSFEGVRLAGVAATCPGGGPVLSNTQGNASKLIYKNGNTRLNAEFTVKLNHFVREREPEEVAERKVAMEEEGSGCRVKKKARGSL